MNIFKDIMSFFEYLSVVDIVFLIAIVVLLILVVTLIYFIKINKEAFTEQDLLTATEPVKEEKVNPIDIVTPNIEEEKYNDEDAELMDLKSLTKKIEEDSLNERVNFTEYEKDQEEKAIISYEELLKKKNKYAINYEKEELVDDLLVKKVNLNDLINKNEVTEESTEDVRVISYQKEEAFLNALKELNSLLN